MKLIESVNLFSVEPSPTNKLIITTNSYITKQCKLVMGRGAAKTLRDNVVGIDSEFARYIEHLGEYGILILGTFGAFQVKHNFKDKANINLIEWSAGLLDTIAIAHPQNIYHMNYPGIGNGGLRQEEVEEVINFLPDNVWVYKL